MNPGDTVEVDDGSYNLGGLTVSRSGCALKPITIMAKNQGQAILTWFYFAYFKEYELCNLARVLLFKVQM